MIMKKGIEFLELRVLEARTGLIVYQEKVLAKFGKYKTPTTKDEALNMKVNMPKNAEEAIVVLSDAHQVINELYDISLKLSKDLGDSRAGEMNKAIEIGKLKARVTKLEKQNKAFTDKMFSS